MAVVDNMLNTTDNTYGADEFDEDKDSLADLLDEVDDDDDGIHGDSASYSLGHNIAGGAVESHSEARRQSAEAKAIQERAAQSAAQQNAQGSHTKSAQFIDPLSAPPMSNAELLA